MIVLSPDSNHGHVCHQVKQGPGQKCVVEKMFFERTFPVNFLVKMLEIIIFCTTFHEAMNTLIWPFYSRQTGFSVTGFPKPIFTGPFWLVKMVSLKRQPRNHFVGFKRLFKIQKTFNWPRVFDWIVTTIAVLQGLHDKSGINPVGLYLFRNGKKRSKYQEWVKYKHLPIGMNQEILITIEPAKVRTHRVCTEVWKVHLSFLGRTLRSESKFLTGLVRTDSLKNFIVRDLTHQRYFRFHHLKLKKLCTPVMLKSEGMVSKKGHYFSAGRYSKGP